jgi:hypothetical protein
LTFDENFVFNTTDQYDDTTGMDLDLDEITQQQLLNKFLKELSPHLPFIYFSPEVTLRHLRNEHAILLSSILAASAASLYPPLGLVLAEKLEREYADRIVIGGEKSIELVQAVLVSSVWYQPPTRFQDLKFTMYGHMAANMALDLRIANDREIDGSELDLVDKLNRKRVVIACYLLCARLVYLREAVSLFDDIFANNFQYGSGSSPSIYGPTHKLGREECGFAQKQQCSR